MTIEEKLADTALTVNYEYFDQQTIEYAKLRIIDTIGALLGGTRSSGADMVLELINDWGGKKESTILGIGKKVPAASATSASSPARCSPNF